MNCKSCGHILTENAKYCDNCGGKVVVTRLTLKAVLAEFFSKLFSWDNKFLKTYKFLIIKPEEVFETFISGGRKKFFHPFSLLLITGTLMAVILVFFPDSLKVNIDEDTMIKSYNYGKSSAGNNNITKNEETQIALNKFNEFWIDFSNKHQDFMYENMSFTILLGIPFYALIAYLVFLPFRKNYAEHLVIQCYQNSVTNIFSIILIIFGIGSWAYSIVALTGMTIYANYSFSKFYKLNLKQFIVSNLKFILFVIPIYMVFSIFLMVVSFFWLLVTNKIELPNL